MSLQKTRILELSPDYQPHIFRRHDGAIFVIFTSVPQLEGLLIV